MIPNIAGVAVALALAFDAGAITRDWLPSQYQHAILDRADGLPSDIVWSVIQDRHGYLWLGTQNGLVRHDGARFTTYNDQRHPEFDVNDVRVVAEAPDGSIWAGTYGGGAVRVADTGLSVLRRSDGLAADIVYDIHFGDDGTTWFATAGGVSRMADGEITSWTAEDGLAANRVFKILEDHGGDLWFATLTGGLSRFDGASFTNFGEAEGLDSPQVHLLHEEGGEVLAGTYAGGMYRAGHDRLAAVPRGSLPRDLSMHSILRDSDGQLWLGTYGSGLWRWRIGGAAERFALPEGDPTHVFDLLEDREGNLWLATMNGLHRLRAGPFRPWGTPEGLTDSTFVATEDPATGTIWAGSEGRGAFGLAPDGTITQLDTDDGLASDSVSSLLFDARGRLWIGTFGGGVQVLTDGRIEQPGVPLPGRQVFALLEDSEGAIWIATEGGLVRWREGSAEIFTAADGLPATLVRHLMEDRHGAIWMSTPEGLARLDGGTFRTWTTADGLASNVVSTTFEDEAGSIWIGMRNGGLARLADGELFQFGPGHGLEQNSVLGLIPDGQGNFWLSGLAGLVRVARSDLDAVAEGRAEAVRARLFDERDGLRSSRFMVGFQPAGVRARDGRIWFPTNRGLVAFDPDEIEPPRPPGEPIIERVRTDSEPMTPAPVLTLPAATRSLEIEYTVPSLHAAERLRFRYRLGADAPWQSAGGRRTAYFTNLPPGEQRFEVQAASVLTGFGDSGDLATAALTIVREPFWHQTAWFRALLVVALAMAAWLIYRAALYQVHRRQRLLEGLVAQRTRELSEALTKVERLSRIDGLTGVANRRYFEEQLARSWAEASRRKAPLSLLMIDLDHFKEFNDSAGHLAGDECLKHVARTLEECVERSSDLVARFGGEEFVVLLPDTDADGAESVGERIRERIDNLKLAPPEGSQSDGITASVGCATARPGHGEQRKDDELLRPEQLLRRADEGMYAAKRAGRNRVAGTG